MANKFAIHVDVVEVPTDPSPPPSGTRRVYAKTDGKMYQRDSSGVITELSNEEVTAMIGVPTFIQDTQPTYMGKYSWIQTNIDGNPDNFTVWFEDGL